ncbi:prepilin-type N-terminal cleavage/methylation domain-containing protein [Parageobacillus thermoglucosidasius]|uniref:prepilin-type N-terminal cleavage/methylation domain-containing protein n=1 Tax=Parageobacillus thermoglucosidasius TaxID=1426 RepID=UPI000E18AF3E|nr:prepilin-type N-terminal cleavage/methylation domain-containing protein [Parageobacillus thermoglucosidasius]RDE20213.1 prepilin-type N-terminal cleavage/methylation domain-containing protein [Parageobacillus thermoglucosidasius]
MEEKNFLALRSSKGFTLLEVLASITILSIVAIGMFSFFTNAMQYTTYNQDKTVAINIARGVLAYMERLDFTELKQYVESKMNNTDSQSFVYLNASDCSADGFPLLGGENDKETNQKTCERALGPAVNNIDYKTRVHIFLVPYDKKAQDELKANPPEQFPASLIEKIRLEDEENINTDLQNYLLKIYVIVRWGDRVEDSEWLEGVIADETIR